MEVIGIQEDGTLIVKEETEGGSAVNVADGKKRKTIVAGTVLIRRAETLKREGNEALRGKETKLAMKAYESAVDMLTKVMNEDAWSREDESVERTRIALLVALWANLSQCRLTRNELDQAIKCASAVLAVDPNHVKARYRRGLALERQRKVGLVSLHSSWPRATDAYARSQRHAQCTRAMEDFTHARACLMSDDTCGGMSAVSRAKQLRAVEKALRRCGTRDRVS